MDQEEEESPKKQQKQVKFAGQNQKQRYLDYLDKNQEEQSKEAYEEEQHDNFKFSKVSETNASKRRYEEPEISCRVWFISIFTLVAGLTFLLTGFLQEFVSANPGDGVPFFVLAVLFTLPGAFFTFRLCKAKNAETIKEKKEWISELSKL